MTSFEFEKLTKEALLEIPEHIREKMDNVAVVIEKRPPFRSLLGLYQGVPKTAWGRAFGMRLPDKITIFQEPLERMAQSQEELKEIVKNTVWHEVAHHFGFSEKERKVYDDLKEALDASEKLISKEIEDIEKELD